MNVLKSKFFRSSNSASDANNHPGNSINGVSLSLISQILSYAFNLSVLVGIGGLTARYLGPENLGLINYASAVATLLTPFIHLGINKSLPIFLAKEDSASDLMFTSFVIELSMSILLCILIFAVGFNRVNLLTILLIYFAFAAQFLGNISNIFKAYLLNFHKGTLLARVNLYSSIFFCLISGLSLLLKADLLIFGSLVFFKQLFSLALFSLFSLRFKRIRLPRFNYNQFVALIRRGLPLIFASFCMVLILKSDVVMIEWFLGPTKVGLYVPAVTSITALYFIPQVMANTFIPRLVDNSFDTNLEISRYFRLSWLVGLILLFFNIALLPSLINIIYGDQYLESLRVIIYLAPAGLAYVLQMALTTYLNSRGFVNIIFKGNLISALLNIILNLFLIPAFGIYGAAIASSLSLVTGLFIVSLLDKRSQSSTANLLCTPFKMTKKIY